jgi:hypothetical protein
VDSAIRFGRERVSRSLAALDVGRQEDATRELMEFILMVLTPMQPR